MRRNFQNVQFVGGGFLTIKDQLRFFVGARSGDCLGGISCTDELHGAWDGNGTTGTATLRRDGFASLTPTSNQHPGTLTTVPLSFSGKYLFVNVNASNSNSTLSVELLDSTKKIAMTSHLISNVDSTRLLVTWTDGGCGQNHWASVNLTSAAPSLRFTLTGETHLFAFWFSTDRKCGASRGPVAAGGRPFTSAWDTHGACSP